MCVSFFYLSEGNRGHTIDNVGGLRGSLLAFDIFDLGLVILADVIVAQDYLLLDDLRLDLREHEITVFRGNVVLRLHRNARVNTTIQRA